MPKPLDHFVAAGYTQSGKGAATPYRKTKYILETRATQTYCLFISGAARSIVISIGQYIYFDHSAVKLFYTSYCEIDFTHSFEMESILIELLYVIGDCCDDPQILAALCRSSRRNYEALHLGIYRGRRASGTCQHFQNQDLHVEISSRIKC